MTDETLTLYRCTECGKLSVSLGYIHGHAEEHNPGWGPFGLFPHPKRTGNTDVLDEFVEELTVSVEKTKYRGEPV